VITDDDRVEVVDSHPCCLEAIRQRGPREIAELSPEPAPHPGELVRSTMFEAIEAFLFNRDDDLAASEQTGP
jgi:hypothetical protein